MWHESVSPLHQHPQPPHMHPLNTVHLFKMHVYILLAKGPVVFLKKFEKKKNNILKKNLEFFLTYNPPRYPWVSTTNFRPIGPAVWPAMDNIHINTNFLFYYIDMLMFMCLELYSYIDMPFLYQVWHFYFYFYFYAFSTLPLLRLEIQTYDLSFFGKNLICFQS